MAVGAIREFFKEEEKGLTAFQERMKETTDVLDKLNTELARMKAVSDLGLLGSSTSAVQDRKSTRLNSSHMSESRMPSSA